MSVHRRGPLSAHCLLYFGVIRGVGEGGGMLQGQMKRETDRDRIGKTCREMWKSNLKIITYKLVSLNQRLDRTFKPIVTVKFNQGTG